MLGVSCWELEEACRYRVTRGKLHEHPGIAEDATEMEWTCLCGEHELGGQVGRVLPLLAYFWESRCGI